MSSREIEEQRNKIRQENNPGVSSEGVVGAAVALAATTALFYRFGGAKYLSNGLNGGLKIAKDLKRISDSRLSGQVTYKDVKNFYKDTTKAWYKRKDEVNKTPITLDTTNRKNLFGFIETLKTLNQEKQKIVHKEFINQYYIDPAKKQFDEIFGEYSTLEKSTKSKFEQYLKDMSYAFGNIEAMTRVKYKHKFNTVKEQEKTDEIDKFLKSRYDNSEERDAFRNQTYINVDSQLKKLKEKSVQINNLEEQFLAKSNDFVQKLIDSTTNTRAATVQDLLDNKDKIQDQIIYSKNKNRNFISSMLKEVDELRQNIREKQGVEAEQRFLRLNPDKVNLRVDGDGNLYSTAPINEFKQTLLNVGANTLPGKILRLRSFEQKSKTPNFLFMQKGSFDPYLAANLNTSDNNKTLDASYYQLGNKIYKSTNNDIQEVQVDFSNHLVSGVYGAEHKLINSLTGNNKYKKSNNKIFRFLDVFQDREEYSGNIINKIKSIGNKDNNHNWRGNKYNELFNPSEEQKEELLNAYNTDDSLDSYNYAIKYSEKYKALNAFFKKNVYDVTRKTINEIADSSKNKESKTLLNILANTNDDEILNKLLKYKQDNKLQLINENLIKLIDNIFKDKNKELDKINLKTDRENTNLSTSVFDVFNFNPNHEAEDFSKRLKVEILKEAFLQESKKNDNKFDFSNIFDLFKNVTNKEERQRVEQLGSYGIFEFKTGINSARKDRNKQELWGEISRVNYILSSSVDETDKKVRKNLQDIVSSRVNKYEVIQNIEDDDVVPSEEMPEWIHIGDTIGPMQIIKNLNNFTKTKNSIHKGIMQFSAGYDRPEDITTATLQTYFLAHRLSDSMNILGLGFSNDSLKSLPSLLFNIGAKRILPAAIAGTYLEWTDDTSQELTGTSVSGAMANGLANIDLAARKASDFTGLTDWLKKEKQINPIMQYWGDHNEFMSYDERKKWYESGYDPVRKGAWWTFGGVAEARGGEISYWQPSYARRINSDYEDKSLYDGYFDKWSHSLLPTPSNPFSPIAGLLDPYWLEKKHALDRPYPISGPMFAEGTPWGAILNPTLGRIIKPQKELYPERLNNGIDLKVMLHQMNDYIKNKAENLSGQNTFVVNGNNIDSINYTLYNTLSDNQYISSINIHNVGNNKTFITTGLATKKSGSIPTYHRNYTNSNSQYGTNHTSVIYDGIDTTIKPLNDFNVNIEQEKTIGYKQALKQALIGEKDFYQTRGTILQDDNGNLGIVASNYLKKENYEFELKDSLALDKVINGDPFSIKSNLISAVHNLNPFETIKDLNYNIRKQVYIKQNRKNDFKVDDSSGIVGYDEQGVVSPEKLKTFSPTQSMEILDDSYQIDALLHAQKGAGFVQDAKTSLRLATGIYGYMANELTGFGNNTIKQMASSSDMTSFSRTFWDANIGGAGGDVMEIVRRFIPDFKRGNRINPLLNTMPDWLPDRFHFGDPYTGIQKGEMRLPGKGYESLNQLHPDIYGRYGALDRFKILADVAPFSPEFKLWKNIAEQTVKDPNLISEMDETMERVHQQGKKHDFYNYGVVGKDVDYQNIVVSEVLGYGKFKSGDTIYKLAGVTVKGNNNESAQDVLGKYIHPGDSITIAVDKNKYTGTNADKDHTINAAVFSGNHVNIAELMVKNGDAKERTGDISSAATLPNYTAFQQLLGYGSELIAHMDLPWISDQFLRVRSPLESYSAEQVYGTPYQSWDHPINTFLLPAIERAIHEPSYMPKAIYELAKDKNNNRLPKKLIDASFLFADRGAFIGAATTSLIYPKNGSKIMGVAKLSSELINIARFVSGGDSYISEIASGATLGTSVAKFFEKDWKKGALFGAIVSPIYKTLIGSDSWIPDRAKKNWDMNDYFDRLTYIKYMGLYHDAAEKAKDEEGVDVERIERQIEFRENQRKSIFNNMDKIKKALNITKDSPEKERLIKLVNSKISTLDPQKTLFEGGEWTQTALIYKKAAENTMTALNPGADWSQILTALPTNDREYFIEFVKEKDPDKRNDILKTVSPQLRKALLISWGKGEKRTNEEINEDNEKYFKRHFLPQAPWIGWRPNIDLKDIQIKTIANEGMNLSDFGFYESQLRDPNVKAVKAIPMRMTSLNISSNLKRVLEGKGIEDVNVSVSESQNGSATDIICNFSSYTNLRGIENMVTYGLQQML